MRNYPQNRFCLDNLHLYEVVRSHGIQGRSHGILLQDSDNTANGHLGLARWVKIFEKLKKKVSGENCHLPTISKIVNNKQFLLTIKKIHENFHEIFGFELSVVFASSPSQSGKTLKVIYYDF